MNELTTNYTPAALAIVALSALVGSSKQKYTAVLEPYAAVRLRSNDLEQTP